MYGQLRVDFIQGIALRHRTPDWVPDVRLQLTRYRSGSVDPRQLRLDDLGQSETWARRVWQVVPAQSAGPVVELIASRSGRPLVIALDGPSAAGTTTLAAVLARELYASVVHMDDFYRDMPHHQRWGLTAVEGVDLYFDWQRLRREALEPLKAGRPAPFRPYSWQPEGGLAVEPVTIAPADVVIAEGVYSARPELADLVDLAVPVETPAEERRRRMVARGHGSDEWWPRWGAAEEYYFDAVRPRDSFDLIVPGQ